MSRIECCPNACASASRVDLRVDLIHERPTDVRVGQHALSEQRDRLARALAEHLVHLIPELANPRHVLLRSEPAHDLPVAAELVQQPRLGPADQLTRQQSPVRQRVPELAAAVQQRPRPRALRRVRVLAAPRARPLDRHLRRLDRRIAVVLPRHPDRLAMRVRRRRALERRANRRRVVHRQVRPLRARRGSRALAQLPRPHQRAGTRSHASREPQPRQRRHPRMLVERAARMHERIGEAMQDRAALLRAARRPRRVVHAALQRARQRRDRQHRHVDQIVQPAPPPMLVARVHRRGPPARPQRRAAPSR
jgi:hypothetical protein